MTLNDLKTGIDAFFGRPLEWEESPDSDDEFAYIECPGKDKHTTANGPRDARIYANNACAIYCFHSGGHCDQARAEVSESIRRHIGVEPASKAETRKREFLRAKNFEAFKFAERIQTFLPEMFRDYDPRKYRIDWHLSPREQWEIFFNLYQETDVLWIGEEHHSSVHGKGHFSTVADWRKARQYWRFVCPGVFDTATRTSRNHHGIIAQPYRVLEWDHLDPDPNKNKRYNLAMVQFLIDRFGLVLRAQIDTGRKSIHSWIENDPVIFSDVFIMALHKLGADPASLKLASQIVRFPGVPRDYLNQQILIWYPLTKIS